MDSNKIKGFFLITMTSTFVLFQNFQFMPDDLTGLSPVDHDLREKHAIELLGNREYKKSPASQSQQLSDLHFKLYQDVRAQLKNPHRAHAFRIARAILKESQKHNFDPIFIAAVIKTESTFNPHALGGVGEIGLMQIRPETAKWIAKKWGIKFLNSQELRDPVKNIELGVAYLSYLRDKFESKSYRYIAAYNMGPKNVRRLLAQDKKPKEYATRIVKNYTQTYERLVNLGLPANEQITGVNQPSPNVY